MKNRRYKVKKCFAVLGNSGQRIYKVGDELESIGVTDAHVEFKDSENTLVYLKAIDYPNFLERIK